MVIRQRIKPFIPLIISLLLALVLFFLVKDFIRTVIVGPLLYGFWLVSLIIESIPQGVIWAGFILVMLIFAFASLRKPDTERSPVAQLPPRNVGQVERWARLLARAERDKFTKWRLSSELKRLSRKLLSPVDDSNANYRLDYPDLPPEINAFFEVQQPTKPPFWDWLLHSSSGEPQSALDLDPDVVIDFLEKRIDQ